VINSRGKGGGRTIEKRDGTVPKNHKDLGGRGGCERPPSLSRKYWTEVQTAQNVDFCPGGQESARTIGWEGGGDSAVYPKGEGWGGGGGR